MSLRTHDKKYERMYYIIPYYAVLYSTYLCHGPDFEALQQLVIRLPVHKFKIDIRKSFRVHFLECEEK